MASELVVAGATPSSSGVKVKDRNENAHQLRQDEHALLMELRAVRRKRRAQRTSEIDVHLTAGQRIADTVAATMGSWRFIIIQSTILLLWIALNVTAYVQRWDPYPFILLNLALSFQAAYAAPFIMMSFGPRKFLHSQSRSDR
jgi:uncharacterized membrane protein